MEDYSSLLTKQKHYFETNHTKDLRFRIDALNTLKAGIKEYEDKILMAIKQDLNKSNLETYMTEIGILYSEIDHTIKELPKWIKRKKVKTPITHTGSKSYIYQQPYGITLIIAPWNYPFQLALAPLIGAIAAGNCAVIKPSEYTPETSSILKELISDKFSETFVTVVEGAAETSQALLKENFDYIFFTGSVPVGRIVMEAASKHLTPVTLELGGKSPAIIHKDANLEVAAKRVAWGKFTNAGQTCVAPDYLYVHQDIKQSFLSELKHAIATMYGEHPLENQNFVRIVHEKHFDRLQGFLTNGNTILGGKSDRESLKIEPTLLTDIIWDDAVMQEEIFGPVLPIMEYQDLDNVIHGMQHHPDPLAFYFFSENDALAEDMIEKVSFGGGCINDTIYHLASPYLPFGGVGNSGMGAYHGKESFLTFSHQKSVLKQTTTFDLPLRYPNMKNGLKLLKRLMK
ncbi:aldehyde dehydrogenase (NAD+) [Gracilibacillus orientalis]|uniref:Aldehyde dehydrogenase n=1 Tax=Gracilibacillus orientalis TaxID=334253 RepID=A0A1I4MHB4_9BACI|nr:aldehyde dehydrogenase [Gracilibacillus orientalis]SFM02628.1 aldehyde dehydrogenase (NAD+) [Gracilibacillus orientalis]